MSHFGYTQDIEYKPISTDLLAKAEMRLNWLSLHRKQMPFDSNRFLLAAKICGVLKDLNRIHEKNVYNLQLVADQIQLNESQKVKFYDSVRNFKGIFIPQIARIFINLTSDENENISTIIHECMHAYQYLFRLSKDLQTLDELNIKDPDKVAFLSFYYEVEAHWMTHKHSKPIQWAKTELDRFMNESDNSLLPPKLKLGLIHMITFGTASFIATTSQNVLLPIPDKINYLERRSNYDFSMPISYPYTDKPMGFTGDYDLSYHALFLYSLQKAQFSNRAPFLFDSNHKDRDIFNKLTSNYFVQSSEDIKTLDQNLNNIINYLREPKFGIFDFHTQKDDKYKQLMIRYKSSYDEAILKDRESIFKPGSEGTSADEDIEPHELDLNSKIMPFLEFQPNINFSPIENYGGGK